MPTYEYICNKCNQKFEVFQSIKDEPLKICPQELCRQKRWGKGKVQRLIGGGAGIIFKGSGFYCTDYRSDSYKSAVKKETEVKSSSSADKSNAASPPKPEAKASAATAAKAA